MTVPAQLRAIESPYVGLVPRVERCLAGTSEARFPNCVCDVASDPRLLGSELGHVDVASGAGRTADEAAAAALGEAVERYSATLVPLDRLVYASAAELGDEAVAPARFALFDESQYATRGFPLRRFDETVRVPWVRGWAVRGGAPTWLPAELVFLGEVPSAGRIGYATSSGAACAADPGEAVLRGLLELVERDAFMIVWRSRLSLPLLEWRGHRKLRALDDRYFAPSGLHYAAIDLSPIHGLPSVLGVVRSAPGQAGALGVGAGTATTIARAWWKALLEAFAAQGAGRRVSVVDPEPPAADDIQTFGDHIHYFAFAACARAADFLDASGERIDVRDVPTLPPDGVAAATAAVLDRIERAGSSAYAADVTSPDVARLGLRVVKTLAPELCPLDSSHRARFLGGARQRRAAFELGLLDRPLRLDELNPDPHPFP